MSRLFNNITIAATLLAAAFAMTACGEDEKDENNVPEIYANVVEPLYSTLKNETSCAEIITKCNKFAADNEVLAPNACAAYAQSLKEANNKPSYLSEKLTNSGYYLATYLLVHKLHDNANGCSPAGGVTPTQAQNAFEGLFKHPGCESFLNDAKTISDARGSNR